MSFYTATMNDFSPSWEESSVVRWGKTLFAAFWSAEKKPVSKHSSQTVRVSASSCHWSDPKVRQRTRELDRLFTLYGAQPVVLPRPKTRSEEFFRTSATVTTRKLQKAKGIFKSFMTRVAVPLSVLMLGAAVLLPLHKAPVAFDNVVTKPVRVVHMAAVSRPMPMKPAMPEPEANVEKLAQSAPVPAPQPVVLKTRHQGLLAKTQSVKPEIERVQLQVPATVAHLVSSKGFRYLSPAIQEDMRSCASMSDMAKAELALIASSQIGRHTPQSRDVAQLIVDGFMHIKEANAFKTPLGRKLAARMAWLHMGNCGVKKNVEKAAFCAFMSPESKSSARLLKALETQNPELFTKVQASYQNFAENYVSDQELAILARKAREAQKFIVEKKAWLAQQQALADKEIKQMKEDLERFRAQPLEIDPKEVKEIARTLKEAERKKAKRPSRQPGRDSTNPEFASLK